MIKSFFNTFFPKRRIISDPVSDSQNPLISVLGFVPCDPQYYYLAFLHKSALVKDNKGQKLDNERLEFLGDALLQAVISDVLYHHIHPALIS